MYFIYMCAQETYIKPLCRTNEGKPWRVKDFSSNGQDISWFYSFAKQLLLYKIRDVHQLDTDQSRQQPFHLCQYLTPIC